MKHIFFPILPVMAILFDRMEPFVQFWEMALRGTFLSNYFKFGLVKKDWFSLFSSQSFCLAGNSNRQVGTG